MILSVLYTTAPITLGGILHMFVVRANWCGALARPLDGGMVWRGKRLLGDHKTWRGIVVIVAATVAFTGLQRILETSAPRLVALNLCDLGAVGWWRAGLVWGLAYAAAELPNSFLKRRLDVAPGAGSRGAAGTALALLDQADSAIGVAFAGWLALGIDAAAVSWIIAVCTALHLLLNALLGLTKIRARAL